MKKRTKKQQAIDAARIQRAITGFMIPMGVIPPLYKHAEQLIADGADDVALRNGIAEFLGA